MILKRKKKKRFCKVKVNNKYKCTCEGIFKES